MFSGNPPSSSRARLIQGASARAAKRAEKRLTSLEINDALDVSLDPDFRIATTETSNTSDPYPNLARITLLAPKLTPLLAERIKAELKESVRDLRVIFNTDVNRFEVYAVVDSASVTLRQQIAESAKQFAGEWPVYVRLIGRAKSVSSPSAPARDYDLKDVLAFRERNKPLKNLGALSDQIDRDLPIGCYLLRLLPFECQLEDGAFRGVQLKAYVPAEKKASFLSWWKRAEEKFHCRILPQISWASEDFNKFLANVAGKKRYLDASNAERFKIRLRELAEPDTRKEIEMPALNSIKHLKDLRHLAFVTIDPEGTEDMEDALYAEKLPNGNYKLYVGYIDVSWYCELNSALFSKVQRRGFSVYGSDAAYPLLGQKFGFGLGSFHQNQDRLAWTIELEISPHGAVLEADVYRSVLRSVAKLTPESAAQRIDNEKLPLVALQNVASLLRARRSGRNSKNITPTSRFDLVVEGCMVGANTELAEILKEEHRDAVFITYATPNEGKKLEMAATLRDLEHPTLGPINVHADDFDSGMEFERIWLELRNRGECVALHDVAHTLFPASRASVEPYSHKGIPAKQYARIKGNTSTGILLQHIVKAMVDGEPPPVNIETIRKIVRTFNRQSRSADACSAQAGLSQMLARNLPLCGSTFNATIVKVLDNGSGYHVDVNYPGFKKFAFLPLHKLPNAQVGQALKVTLDYFSLEVNRFEVSPTKK